MLSGAVRFVYELIPTSIFRFDFGGAHGLCDCFSIARLEDGCELWLVGKIAPEFPTRGVYDV